jgi:hypothetical protein
MSINSPLPERFGKVINKSPYTAQDPIVKINYLQKGNHVIFGASRPTAYPSNLIYLGKIFENTPGKSYLGCNAWLDISFPHVAYITGTRGSGKSFDLGVLLEGLSTLANPSPIQANVTPQTSILLDLQNQFWTLRYEPRDNVEANAAQLAELEAWGLEPNRLADCRILIPRVSSKLIGDEEYFTLKTSDVLASEWCSILGQSVYSPQGHVISRTLDSFLDQLYDLEDMIAYISADANWGNISDTTRNAVTYKLSDLARSRLFSRDGLEIRSLLVPGRCNVFMLRDLTDEDKSLVAAVIARQLFRTMGDYHSKRKTASFFRTEAPGDDLPSRVWLAIDEAHVVAPSNRESPAREALVEFVKRGRDAGLSLVLATQQPSAIDDRILSQVNLSLNHRLTFQSDITSAVARVPTKTLSSLKIGGAALGDFGDMLRLLDSGQCFVGDHSTSRVVTTLIRPRLTPHGGYNPA